MKTQISIQVKNENWISRCMSIYMSLGLFVKAKVNVYVDRADVEPLILKARKEPYVLDLEAGEHMLVFETKGKAKADKFFAGAVGTMLGMGSGHLGATIAAAQGASDFITAFQGHDTIKDNQLICTLREGDVLKISVKPKRNGVVKIKTL